MQGGDRLWQVQANDQATHAADYLPLIVGYSKGGAVRLSDVAAVRDGQCAVRVDLERLHRVVQGAVPVLEIKGVGELAVRGLFGAAEEGPELQPYELGDQRRPCTAERRQLRGEGLDDLEAFHPDRMASRILGMGDVLSLIEKAQEAIDVDSAKRLAESMKHNEFTLDMFLDQMKQVKRLGSLESILSMIPGMGKFSKQFEGVDLDGKEVRRLEAIITSMTPKERQNPRIINGSRRKRIAAGCGQRVQDVNRLLKQFEESKKLMKTMQGMNKYARKGRFKLPFMQ